MVGVGVREGEGASGDFRGISSRDFVFSVIACEPSVLLSDQVMKLLEVSDRRNFALLHHLPG
jgi:hypothetical protein